MVVGEVSVKPEEMDDPLRLKLMRMSAGVGLKPLRVPAGVNMPTSCTSRKFADWERIVLNAVLLATNVPKDEFVIENPLIVTEFVMFRTPVTAGGFGPLKKVPVVMPEKSPAPLLVTR